MDEPVNGDALRPSGPSGEPPGQTPEPVDHAVQDMETTVSLALRWGVLLSAAVLLVGSIWLFASGHTGYGGVHVSGAHALDSLTAYHASNATQWFPSTPSQVISGLRAGRPFALMTLGLLVLIATPVFRVAVSVVTFLWEHDRMYAMITFYVLMVLLVSFVIGKGG